MPKAEHERRTAALRKELEDSTTQIERLKLELEEKGKKLQELLTQEKETKEKEINELKVQIENLNKELEEAKRRAEEAERKLKERKPTKTEIPAKPKIPGLSPDGKTYTVQKGDTSLKSIAKKIYGDESKWQEIYNLNADRIKQGKINPGDILILPEK
jgi:nucleoid-associated protein YgaU